MAVRIKKGDKVEIIAGNSKGERGEVIRVVNKNGKIRVAVQGANIRKKHQRQTQVPGMRQGSLGPGIIQFEGLIDISNVMLIDPKQDKPTRFSAKRDADGKVESRVARKSGEAVGK
jgi:large subunit ribosomal protein L24